MSPRDEALAHAARITVAIATEALKARPDDEEHVRTLSTIRMWAMFMEYALESDDSRFEHTLAGLGTVKP